MKKIKILLPVMAMLAVGVAGFTGSEAKVANAEQFTATYTVSSKTEVTTSGTAPSGSSATFLNNGSNNNDQMIAGKSETLTLKGYNGYIVKGITLNMKSNSSKGAGKFTATAGTTVISSIADSKFNTSNWNGAWSGSTYVNITPKISNSSYVIQSGENLVLKIEASQNSLYCKAFSITYEAAALPDDGPVNYTATFDATPAKFVNSADGSMTVEAEEAGAEAAVTLPTADKLANNGLFYAGTAKVTGWEDADGNTYGFGDEVTITESTTFTQVTEQLTKEVTIAQANEIAEEAGSTNSLYQYTTSGTVKSIKTPYDSSYGNITVIIEDENGDSIEAYRMKAADGYDVSGLEVGSEITVTGYLVNYSGTLEFATGCTAVVKEKEDILAPTNLAYDNDTYTLSWDEVTGAEAYSLVITGSEGEVVNEVLTETSYNIASLLDDTYNVEVVALGDPTHKDSEVAAIEFTKVAPATETVKFIETKASLGFGYNKTVTGDAEVVTYTAKYSGGVTGNMEDKVEATDTLGLTGSCIKVIPYKGTADNAPGLNKDNDFRLYATSDNSQYLEFISTSKVTSIKITFTGSSYANALVSLDKSTAITGTGSSATVKEYEINSNTFFIGNSQTSGQVRIKSIEINVGSQETTWEFGNVRMRFQATVDADLYTRLNAEAAGFEVTAAGSTKVETIDCTANVGTNEEGNRYIIGSITQIPETAYNTVLTAKAFFTVAGEKVYLQEVSYSVATLVEEYLTEYYDSLDAEAKEAITAFSKTL